MFDTPYVVCENCGHNVTVYAPLDKCENCGVNSTFLHYYADPDAADDHAAEVFDVLEDERRNLRALNDAAGRRS